MIPPPLFIVENFFDEIADFLYTEAIHSFL